MALHTEPRAEASDPLSKTLLDRQHQVHGLRAVGIKRRCDQPCVSGPLASMRAGRSLPLAARYETKKPMPSGGNGFPCVESATSKSVSDGSSFFIRARFFDTSGSTPPTAHVMPLDSPSRVLCLPSGRRLDSESRATLKEIFNLLGEFP